MKKFVKKASEKSDTPFVGLVYARVSSKRQEIEGSGLEGQAWRCAQELKNRGITHEKSFLDSYSGGGDFMNRPAMRDLIAYVDANPHKNFVVIFDDLKRFARDVEFHLKLRAVFTARGVQLLCLNYNFDNTPEGKFAELVMAGQAELERQQNRRQVIQKQKARLEAGYWPFGSKKGYTMTKHLLHGMISIPNENASLLKTALEKFAEGSLRRKIDLCTFLVENGFWNKQRPEKYIDKVDDILRSSFYAGFIEYPKWDVTRRSGHHKGIISLDTFNLIQKRLKNDLNNKRIRLDISSDFPLRGLVLCGYCGEPLTASWSKGRNTRYALYRCQNRRACEFAGKSIRRKELEDSFDEVLKQNTLKRTTGELVRALFDDVWQEEVQEIETRRMQAARKNEAFNEQIKEFATCAAKATSEVRVVYEAQIKDLLLQKDALEVELLEGIDYSVPYRTALGMSIGLLENPYEIWKTLEVQEQHELFGFIFEQKLPYIKNVGYRTTDLLSSKRLFEDFAMQNPPMVEMPGIEPGSKKKVTLGLRV